MAKSSHAIPLRKHEKYPCPNCGATKDVEIYGPNGLNFQAVCPECGFNISAREKTAFPEVFKCVELWNEFSKLKGNQPIGEQSIQSAAFLPLGGRASTLQKRKKLIRVNVSFKYVGEREPSDVGFVTIPLSFVDLSYSGKELVGNTSKTDHWWIKTAKIDYAKQKGFLPPNIKDEKVERVYE